MLVYSLFDRKLGEYGSLVLARNDDSIRRSVLDGIRGTNSLVELHPEDFDLMHVGSFDVEHGALDGSSTRFVASVASILTPDGKGVSSAQEEVKNGR